MLAGCEFDFFTGGEVTGGLMSSSRTELVVPVVLELGELLSFSPQETKNKLDVTSKTAKIIL